VRRFSTSPSSHPAASPLPFPARFVAAALLIGFFQWLAALESAAGADGLHYDCRAITETMTIDGDLTERAWRDADAIPFHVPVTHAVPQTQATGRLCWDADYLYVAFESADEDLEGTRITPDSQTYLDDVDEVFLQPGVYDSGYHNLEINVLGTVYDAHNGVAGGVGAGWTCSGLRHAARTIGTINNSTDRDTGWRLELAIPFSSLIGLEKVRPDAGDVWPFHLARYDYSAYIPGGKELSSCALLSQPKYHNRADWIELRFLEAAPPVPGLTGFMVR